MANDGGKSRKQHIRRQQSLLWSSLAVLDLNHIGLFKVLDDLRNKERFSLDFLEQCQLLVHGQAPLENASDFLPILFNEFLVGSSSQPMDYLL